MRIISCHRDLLEALAEREHVDCGLQPTGPWEEKDDREHGATGGSPASISHQSFLTGLDELDGLPPRGAFTLGAVHEVLSEPVHGLPRFFALLLARSAASGLGQERERKVGAVVWSDPRQEV